MTRTYVKGRISKDKRRGFKRSITNKCRCSYCYDPHRKGHRKTDERNLIKSLLKVFSEKPYPEIPKISA